jgi:hypothetical protein
MRTLIIILLLLTLTVTSAWAVDVYHDTLDAWLTQWTERDRQLAIAETLAAMTGAGITCPAISLERTSAMVTAATALMQPPTRSGVNVRVAILLTLKNAGCRNDTAQSIRP